MANQTEATNYYEVLEVSTDAPTHEIHKAYHRAKATYSADNPALYSMFSADEARELLRLIEEAYSVLGNPSLRQAYDEARARGESQPQVSLRSVAASIPMPSAQPAPQSPVTPAQMATVASEHRALPDFGAPKTQSEMQPEMTSSFGVKTIPSTAKSSLPPGTGRTSMSTYKIDEQFETEVAGALDFDGAFLQRIRLYKNISIDRMSEATRISRPYLTAVESNDFKNLPAAVFTRGFIVQIARILGLNDSKVAASYIKMFKAGGGK